MKFRLVFYWDKNNDNKPREKVTVTISTISCKKIVPISWIILGLSDRFIVKTNDEGKFWDCGCEWWGYEIICTMNYDHLYGTNRLEVKDADQRIV